MHATPRLLLGLATGLALGALAPPAPGLAAAAAFTGGLWLDALRMTVVPLVFTLVATGIAATAGRATGGPSWRAAALFAALLTASALAGAALGSLLLPLGHPSGLDALRTSLAAVPPPPPALDWLRRLVPANPVAAAAEGAVAPLTVFALFFGLALARLGEDRTRPLTAALTVAADALLTIVGWVMRLAPLGIAALAYGAAARAGTAVGAALGWYVLVQIAVTLALGGSMYALAATFGRVRPVAFARALAPVQAIALGTQSSLASLPAMVAAAARLHLPAAAAAATIPLAVALFRLAAPASIVVVTLALAGFAGIALGPAQLAATVALAVVGTLSIAGLPNSLTFFAAYAPPALAAGVPVELLPLLLAVDAIPDMAYTATNVTADLAVTAILARAPTAPRASTA